MSQRLAFRGRLDVETVPGVWAELHARLGDEPGELTLDVRNVTYCDMAGAVLLSRVAGGDFGRSRTVSWLGLSPDLERLLGVIPSRERAAELLMKKSRGGNFLEQFGEKAAGVFRDIHQETAFLGHVLSAFATALSRRRLMRWREVFAVANAAGVNGLPIVLLINFLIGLIIAFIGSHVLEQFGAQIFVADAIGIIMIRELGPIMTAILVAGRSGSAFAAEIGTMKVNEELDALETMGLDPVRFLVVQRVLAGTLMTPVLCLHGMVAGVMAGLLQMRLTGFPLAICTNRLASAVGYGDVLLGAFKGLLFGFLVSAIGCLRGLQTRKGPSAVGESATRAVVAGIFLIILADAVLAVVTTVLGI